MMRDITNTEYGVKGSSSNVILADAVIMEVDLQATFCLLWPHLSVPTTGILSQVPRISLSSFGL